jgi:mRNA-degrading endonuclease RelE of RelBE toxin-antitoxin system
MAYPIEYSPSAEEHLLALSKREQRTVLDQVDKQLTHQPKEPTRHRKRLRPNVLAEWELRIGDLRVYYVVTEEPAPLVSVLAVGKKQGNRVLIAGIEVKL